MICWKFNKSLLSLVNRALLFECKNTQLIVDIMLVDKQKVNASDFYIGGVIMIIKNYGLKALGQDS